MVTWARVGVLDFNACSKALILPGLLDLVSSHALVRSLAICMVLLISMLIKTRLDGSSPPLYVGCNDGLLLLGKSWVVEAYAACLSWALLVASIRFLCLYTG